MNHTIEKVEVENDVIQALVFDKLMPVCHGEITGHAILALLTLSVLMMKPQVEMDTLRETVMAMSETAILHLMEAPEGEAN